MVDIDDTRQTMKNTGEMAWHLSYFPIGEIQIYNLTSFCQIKYYLHLSNSSLPFK